MKKAKVRNGLIQHVWPWVKTLPDGTQITKELPPQYQKHAKLGDKHPDCIIDVPDDVQPGYRWHDVLQRYASKKELKEKDLLPKPKIAPPDPVLLALAEMLGVSWEELKAKAQAHKKAGLDKVNKTH